MDDHHPAGFGAVKIGAPATVFHEAPSPYAIPYRSLYSRNVPNLMFAGRVASCTHAAMSSTRVMGTGCSMGQAVGVAAALATARVNCSRPCCATTPICRAWRRRFRRRWRVRGLLRRPGIRSRSATASTVPSAMS